MSSQHRAAHAPPASAQLQLTLPFLHITLHKSFKLHFRHYIRTTSDPYSAYAESITPDCATYPDLPPPYIPLQPLLWNCTSARAARKKPLVCIYVLGGAALHGQQQRSIKPERLLAVGIPPYIDFVNQSRFLAEIVDFGQLLRDTQSILNRSERCPRLR